VHKIAFTARSLRDNLELFDLLGRAPKPTIALGMGRFGLMSRVLAPKFGGFLTFASLCPSSTTAPGQPTIDELFGTYRFRAIGRATKVYGVVGWPVEHSKGPLVHNAGFEAVGWDGVYLPLPVAADADDREASGLSFETTVRALAGHGSLGLRGVSVTVPHKEHAAVYGAEPIHAGIDDAIGAVNTLHWSGAGPGAGAVCRMANTDASAIGGLLGGALGDLSGASIGIVGAGGVARAALAAAHGAGASATVYCRDLDRAAALREIDGGLKAEPLDELVGSAHDAYINCTPIGMAGGSDPEGLSIPIPEMVRIGAGTVFFDTVYTPAETPMLRAARERGCRTIDGAAMFVRQAAGQFEVWTGRGVPGGLFEGLVEGERGGTAP